MKTVSIHEAKTHFSSLINAVEKTGEKIIIQRHGKAVAELSKISNHSRLRTDAILKKIKILDDPIEPTEQEWEDV